MIAREEALQLLAYDRWANGRVARLLAEIEPGLAEAERVWAHVVGAEELWFERVVGGDYRSLAVWPRGVGLEGLAQRFERVSERWREHFERADGAEMARVVRFTNTKGEACGDPLEAIVRQLVLHGSHHRGQIAGLVRAAGRVPENLDYIVWRRTRAEVGVEAPRAWKHFVVESTYVAPVERIDEHLAAHRAHLAEGFECGLLLASGPQEPRTGGLILARAGTRAELDAFLARDPFQREGLWRTRVVEFRPVQQADEFAGWAARA